jgi:hypothetical protein
VDMIEERLVRHALVLDPHDLSGMPTTVE